VPPEGHIAVTHGRTAGSAVVLRVTRQQATGQARERAGSSATSPRRAASTLQYCNTALLQLIRAELIRFEAGDGRPLAF
jgi:hypothetical protein